MKAIIASLLIQFIHIRHISLLAPDRRPRRPRPRHGAMQARRDGGASSSGCFIGHSSGCFIGHSCGRSSGCFIGRSSGCFIGRSCGRSSGCECPFASRVRSGFAVATQCPTARRSACARSRKAGGRNSLQWDRLRNPVFRTFGPCHWVVVPPRFQVRDGGYKASMDS